jgi:hypothetical protein
MGVRLAAAAIMLFAVSFQSFAATGKIAFSDPSAKVGDEVSVTMKVTCVEGEALGNTDVMLKYDTESLEYINETENASGGAGAIRVWSAPLGSAEASTVLRFKALKEGTTTITITSWEAYDNDGKLLTSAKEGSSKITIAASASGETQIENNENVAEETSEAVEGSEAESMEQEDVEVLAELDVTAKKIRIINVPADVEIPSGFRESSIAIGDTKVPGWTWAADESPRYCVFYGMNENGEANFYRYDLAEKTVQRYFEDQSSTHTDEEYDALAENYNSLLDDFNISRIVAAAALALAVILLIALIVSRLGAKKKANDPYERFDREPQSRGSRKSTRPAEGKKLTKEERYMMGEEEEYEDEDDYEKTAGEDPAADVDIDEEALTEDQEAAQTMEQLEDDLAKETAKSIAETTASKEDDSDDDFEFFDL